MSNRIEIVLLHDPMHSTVLAIVQCLSIHLSVCLSHSFTLRK